jgi:transmembrane sensor
MSDAFRDGDAERRLTEAAAWRVRLAEAEAHTSPAFEHWLSEARNLTAWQQVSRGWEMLDDLARAPAMMRARDAAIDDAERTRRNLRGPLRTRRWAGLAAAMVVLGFAGYGSYAWWNQPDDYSTAVGERRVITLADGSKLSLDTDSEVTVRYRAHERALRLLKGQARIDVAHDKKRPFSVIAGSQKVIATGTAFNIDMAGPKVLVTLIEGHVVVLDQSADTAQRLWTRRTEMKSGQQLVAEGQMPPEVSRANIARATAWTNGQIIFDDEPLSSVAERVNRYGGPQIVIPDSEVGAMKISGVLNAGDTLGFVEIVTHYLPVRALSEGPNTIALQGEAGKAGSL